MLAHRGDQINNASPVARDSEDPLEDRMPSIEFIGKRLSGSAILVPMVKYFSYPLMELSSDGLAGKKTTLTDQELTALVKCSTGQYHLLCAIFE